MLNVEKFDDINYLEINNTEGEDIINLFYNNYDYLIVRDKYNISKSILALIQFDDYSFGVINDDDNKDNTIIYGITLVDDYLQETDIKALLSFNVLIGGELVDTVAITKHNVSKINKLGIKRVFIPDGYFEF